MRCLDGPRHGSWATRGTEGRKRLETIGGSVTAMRKTSTSEAPALTRGDGVVSRLLHGRRTEPETDMTVTWVTVGPGTAQERHSHEPEQVYVLVAGEGRMHVAGEERSVEAGDLVHVPSGAEHGIENTGDEPLQYVSAATPALAPGDVDAFYEVRRG